MALTVPMQVAVEFQAGVGGSGKRRGQLCLWGSKPSSVLPENLRTRGPLCLWGSKLSSVSLLNLIEQSGQSHCSKVQKQCSQSTIIPNRFIEGPYYLPCQCAREIGPSPGTAFVVKDTLNLTWFSMACKNMQGVVRLSRSVCQNKRDGGWKKGGTYNVTTTYILPLLFFAGVTFKCRTFDPVVPPTEAGQFVKQPISFVVSLSAALAVNFMITCVQLLAEKFRDPHDANRSKKPIIQFIEAFWYSVMRICFTLTFIEVLGLPVINWDIYKVSRHVFSVIVLCQIFKRMRTDESPTAEDASPNSLEDASMLVNQDLTRKIR